MEPERLVVPVRSITRPVLESWVLPELSIILVLGAVVAFLSDTSLREFVMPVLPDTVVRVLAVLPDKPLRVPDAIDDLPEIRVVEVLLLAELVL